MQILDVGDHHVIRVLPLRGAIEIDVAPRLGGLKLLIVVLRSIPARFLFPLGSRYMGDVGHLFSAILHSHHTCAGVVFPWLGGLGQGQGGSGGRWKDEDTHCARHGES